MIGVRQFLLLVKGLLVFRRRVLVYGNFTVVMPRNVRVGRNCVINHDVYILGRTGVEIGDDVVLSTRCMLLDAGLETSSVRGRTAAHVGRPIRLGDRAWIGAGAIILSGVTVGEGGIVGAGSVVTRDVAPGMVVAGNPARPLGDGLQAPAQGGSGSPS